MSAQQLRPKQRRGGRMKRRIAGLTTSSQSDGQVPDGTYLVRIEGMAYRWKRNKPFYSVRLSVIEPEPLQGAHISGCLNCTPQALWKVSWLLHDFGYDQELLGR